MTAQAVLDRAEPLSSAKRKTASETYEEVQDLIRHTVWRLCRRFPGSDFDELMAEAETVFLATWLEYDGRTRFSTRLNHEIWFALFERLRCRAREKQRYADVEDLDSVETGRTFDLPAWLSELPADVAVVVRLVLDSPADVVRAVRESGGRPRNYKRTVKQYLRTRLGWSWERITETFDDVRRALEE